MDNTPEIIKNFISQTESLKSYFDSYEINTTHFKESIGSNDVEKSIRDGMLQLIRLTHEYADNPKKFHEQIKELNKKQNLFPQEIEDDPEAIVSHLAQKFSTETVKYKFEDKKIKLEFVDYRASIDFYKGLKKLERITSQQVLFNHTALLGLTNTFEYFLAQILKDLLTRNIEKTGKDKQVTLETILKFSSFEDVKLFMINDSVNAQLRESKKEIIKKICDYISKDLFRDKFEASAEVMNEIFQRRNLVVHNNAVINDEYIKSVASNLRVGVSIGDKIGIPKSYLHKSLGELTEMYLNLFYRYWSHISKNDDTDGVRFNTFNSIAFAKLSDNDLIMAEKIYDILRSDIKSLSSSNKLLLEINYSQTLKWLGKEDEFKRHFSRIDFSLAHQQHHLCRALLKDDYQSACSILGNILDDEEKRKEDPEYTDISFYIEWPIFRNFIKTPEFDEFMKSKGYEKVSLNRTI